MVNFIYVLLANVNIIQLNNEILMSVVRGHSPESLVIVNIIQLTSTLARFCSLAITHLYRSIKCSLNNVFVRHH
jgi:hypothetical protein